MQLLAFAIQPGCQVEWPTAAITAQLTAIVHELSTGKLAWSGYTSCSLWKIF
jgi:hypothetical protein